LSWCHPISTLRSCLGSLPHSMCHPIPASRNCLEYFSPHPVSSHRSLKKLPRVLVPTPGVIPSQPQETASGPPYSWCHPNSASRNWLGYFSTSAPPCYPTPASRSGLGPQAPPPAVLDRLFYCVQISIVPVIIQSLATVFQNEH